MYTFREATTYDVNIIHDLASRIWENTYKEILSKEQIEYMFDMMYAPNNLVKQMTELKHKFFIIYANGNPAGYLSIEKTGDDSYNFQKIYSLPEIHGKGIGRYIIEQGVEFLKRSHPGSFHVELFVNRHNPAVGFYKHIGFREIGSRDHAIGNGYFMNDYIMGMDVEN